jgi:anti-anti-sigma regulatory factor
LSEGGIVPIRIAEVGLKAREFLPGLVNQGKRQILLNFKGIAAIDSSGIGELVASSVTINSRDGELKVLRLTSRVKKFS